MTSVEYDVPGVGAVGADVYYEVQQFYAHHMQVLDDARVDEWAATFTPDGEMASNAQPTVAGREALASKARTAHAKLAQEGITRRHWLGMVTVRETGVDRVAARCFSLVIDIPKGGKAGLRLSAVCEDELVRTAEGWQISRRMISHDDLD
ncbi:MAG TPA: nuclear transport factor 2 family protein [Actinocrinis sp.]|nr:nuclear transport factor 2 family protein [Actinocrinis sp.]